MTWQFHQTGKSICSPAGIRVSSISRGSSRDLSHQMTFSVFMGLKTHQQLDSSLRWNDKWIRSAAFEVTRHSLVPSSRGSRITELRNDSHAVAFRHKD